MMWGPVSDLVFWVRAERLRTRERGLLSRRGARRSLGVNIVACGNTVDGVGFTADAGRGTTTAGVDTTGHHAIQCKGAEDNFITRFDLRTSSVHDLSVEHASGNVFAHGRGADLCFDHHKDTPYENLFTEIDCGRGTRVWRCGGGASLGRQSAGWETWWNIRAAKPLEPPPKGWGAPVMNFVGLAGMKARAPASVAVGWWLDRRRIYIRL